MSADAPREDEAIGNGRCQKMAFASRGEASRSVRNWDGGWVGRRTRPYRCRRCGLWHLTSLTKKIARSRGLE